VVDSLTLQRLVQLLLLLQRLSPPQQSLDVPRLQVDGLGAVLHHEVHVFLHDTRGRDDERDEQRRAQRHVTSMRWHAARLQ
jgi:hypothetical protein